MIGQARYERARRGRLAAGLLAGLLAAGMAACAAPIHVNAYEERGANVGRYRTYDFAPAEAVATGDPRLDSNPFFYQRVREAVDRGLTARGYTRAAGTPDVIVHFHANIGQDIDVVDLDRRAGYCSEDNDACKPFVYDAGTLVMDLVDGKSHKLAWRGWAKSNLDGIVDNQTWLEERVDKAMAQVVAQVPQAGSGRN